MKKFKGFLSSIVLLSFAFLTSLVSCESVPNPPAQVASPASGRGGLDRGADFSEPFAEVCARYATVESAEKADYQLLLEEDLVTYDKSGSCEVTTHAVVRVLTKEGVNNWSVIDVGWQPWRDERPVIKARVRRVSGTESVLDPKAVVDVGAGDGGYNLRSDRKRTSAPLPNLEVGAIVELLVTERSGEAVPGAGYGRYISLGRAGPVERRVVRFRVAEGLPFEYRVSGADPRVADLGIDTGYKTFELEFDRMSGMPEVEPLLPYDQPARPLLVFGTAVSWRSVAEAYWKTVEPILDPAPVADYVAKALREVDAAADPSGAVKAIAAAIRRDVRYTGVYFGENAIVPHSPADTLASGYGDCKDQASLLVACLRSAGIEARLALLNSGMGWDLEPAVRGLEFFNHAIVYLPALDMWIDPTAFYALPGSLPISDLGRHALVISADTEDLRLIPVVPLGKNWYRRTCAIELAENGAAARVEERITAGGYFDQRYRAIFDDAPRKEHEEILEKSAKSTYSCDKAKGDFSDPADLGTPFETVVVCESSRLGWTDDSLAEAMLKAGAVFNAFPSELRLDDEKEYPKRKNDVYLVAPCVYTIEYHVVAPAGFRLRFVPKPYSIDLEQALLEATFSSPSQDRLDAIYSITPRGDRWSPDAVQKLRLKAKDFFESKATVASFESIGQAFVSEGRYAEALAEFRKLERLHPGEALHHIQAAQALIDAGFAQDAIPEMEEGVRLEPESAIAHKNLAYACLYDPFGVQFGRGADLERAGREYLRAFELNPEAYENLFNYAIIQEMGTDGAFRGKGARLEEAVAAFEKAPSKIESYGHAERYLADLFQLGRYAEVVRASESLKDRQKGAGFLVASIAIRDGTDAAIAQAGALVADLSTRRSIMYDAAGALFSAREYPASADLYIAAARGTPDFASMVSTADLIRGIRRADVPAAGSLASIFIEMIKARFDREDPPPYVSSPLARDSVSKRLRGAAMRDLMKTLADRLGSLGNTEVALVDILSSYCKFVSASSGPIAVVSVSAPGLGFAHLADFLCEVDKGLFQLVDFGDLAGAAAEASFLLEQGDADGARSWLAAARDPKSILPSCRLSLPRDVQELLPADFRDASELSLATALIGSSTRDPALAAKYAARVIEAARASAEGARRQKLYDLALALAWIGEDPNLPAIEGEAAARGAQNADAALYRVNALIDRGFYELAAEKAREASAAYPESRPLKAALVHALECQGLHRQSVDIISAAIDEGSASDNDYNNAAWDMLFLDDPSFAFIEAWGLAHRFDESEPHALHTLVCVFGAAGRYDEARAAFAKLLKARSASLEPSSLWAAHGFLARSFGLSERARASFAKAIELRPSPGDACDSAALAAVWIDRP